MKCKHCGGEFDNPQIYIIHENNCLDHQEQNGLLKEKVDENQENTEKNQEDLEEEKKEIKRAAKKAGDK